MIQVRRPAALPDDGPLNAPTSFLANIHETSHRDLLPKWLNKRCCRK